MYPKIELHVHLEATVRPQTLLEIARRNDAAKAGGLASVPHAGEVMGPASVPSTVKSEEQSGRAVLT